MIRGVVTVDLEAIIRLKVRGPGAVELEVEAVVDTGYNGFLTLPTGVIAALGLFWRRRGRAILADGSGCLFDVYEAMAIWDGRPRGIPIDAADTTPLVGMGMLQGYELRLEAVDGGSVVIKKLSKQRVP